ncbi:MAG TPA: phage holin family protein [Cyclobacteriaceae bacterium]|jgi:polyferredoxin
MAVKEKILKLLKLENLFESVSGYVESKFELFKMEVREEVAGIVARVLVVLLIGLSFLLFLILASIGLAYYLGTLVGMTGGIMIVAGFYLLIFILMIVFRESVSEGVNNMVMSLVRASKKNKDEGR